MNQCDCEKKEKDADSTPAPRFIMSWQELLNNQLSLPNVRVVSSPIKPTNLSNISHGCLNGAPPLGFWPNKNAINNPQHGDPDAFISNTNVFASSWWLQIQRQPWSRVPWRTLPKESNFFFFLGSGHFSNQVCQKHFESLLQWLHASRQHLMEKCGTENIRKCCQIQQKNWFEGAYLLQPSEWLDHLSHHTSTSKPKLYYIFATFNRKETADGVI